LIKLYFPIESIKKMTSNESLEINYKILNEKYTSTLEKLNELFDKNTELMVENTKLKEENDKLSGLKIYLTPAKNEILLTNTGQFNVSNDVTKFNIIMIDGGLCGGGGCCSSNANGCIYIGSYKILHLFLQKSHVIVSFS
jgi:hypothetical protein